MICITLTIRSLGWMKTRAILWPAVRPTMYLDRRARNRQVSLVKAALTEYARRGLRLIEADRADLIDLPRSLNGSRTARSALSFSAMTFRGQRSRIQGFEVRARRRHCSHAG